VGKIFDALEKAANEPKESVPSNVHASGRDARKPPVDNTILALKKRKHDCATKKQIDQKAATINRFHPDLICALKPHSFESEQFKMLKTRILFPSSGETPKTIMVASASPGEGKSFVVANLAVSMAQNINEFVLLMDCDLRRPRIGTLFGCPAKRGLSEHLSSDTVLDDLLVKTSIAKLTILTAGNPPTNPSELLSSQKMTRLLKEARERYSDRYIIIDAPPPSMTAEAHVMAKQVDGIVLVVSYRGAKIDHIKKVAETLGKDKIIGVVFNRVRTPVFSYYGYGKYGKYGKYGRYD
jgi:protein-tyrosine kinase